MRIFNTTEELLSETKRDLFEMGKQLKTYSMQNKVVVDDINYQTRELQNYQFLLNDIENIDNAFNYKEFIISELQRIFVYFDKAIEAKSKEEIFAGYVEDFITVRNQLVPKCKEYNLFGEVINYITEDELMITEDELRTKLSVLFSFYEKYQTFKEEHKDDDFGDRNNGLFIAFSNIFSNNSNGYEEIKDEIMFILKAWSCLDFQERVDESGTVNPGVAYQLRPWVWSEFLENEGKFGYSYNERIVGEKKKLYTIIEEIKKHPTSRQLNLPIFDWNIDYDHFGGGSRVPCSLYYHFMIRPTGKRVSRKNEDETNNSYKELSYGGQTFEISIGYSMRSCDYLTHFAIDFVQAINLLKFVKMRIKDSINVELGTLFYTASSFHAYNKDLIEHVF